MIRSSPRVFHSFDMLVLRYRSAEAMERTEVPGMAGCVVMRMLSRYGEAIWSDTSHSEKLAVQMIFGESGLTAGNGVLILNRMPDKVGVLYVRSCHARELARDQAMNCRQEYLYI